MAEDKVAKKEDEFALEKDTPEGKRPAYPKMLYFPTGEKYANGADICDSVLVRTPEEHKKVLANKERW